LSGGVRAFSRFYYRTQRSLSRAFWRGRGTIEQIDIVSLALLGRQLGYVAVVTNPGQQFILCGVDSPFAHGQVGARRDHGPSSLGDAHSRYLTPVTEVASYRFSCGKVPHDHALVLRTGGGQRTLRAKSYADNGRSVTLQVVNDLPAL